MGYNKKGQLLDKIGGLELVNPDGYGAKYNKGVRDAKARVVSFFNNELVPEVPQYVADWYESNKKNLDYNLWNYIIDWDETEEDIFKRWVNNSKEAFQTIINMHQFGYKIKKEKKYLVKLKGVINGTKALKQDTSNGGWYMGIVHEVDYIRVFHTKKELEAGGFSGVFDNPMFEVEEVEE